jgi:hypothetical protein
VEEWNWGGMRCSGEWMRWWDFLYGRRGGGREGRRTASGGELLQRFRNCNGGIGGGATSSCWGTWRR